MDCKKKLCCNQARLDIHRPVRRNAEFEENSYDNADGFRTTITKTRIRTLRCRTYYENSTFDRRKGT